MEHADLVAEMAHVEHLSTQERLHLARKRRIQQLKVWAAREKDWMRQQRKGRTPHSSNKRHIYFSDSVMLLEAAARNDIEEVERLLKKGVNADSTNEDGLTALHQCCIDDNERMMKLLLDYGANVNAEDSERWTPLHAAATCGHLHLVRYLINSGADLLAVNADGNMPYDICEDESALDHIESAMASRGVTQELIDETRGSTELRMLHDLEQLVAQGRTRELEQHDHQGATPLHIASANGYLRVVEFLLDQHVSTDVRDNDDWQPVHAAACWGHMEVLEVLVQNGADLNAKTKHDETPADICEDPELRERIVQLRSEQETKRAAEAQRKRVRRSQSNTRTQSVRRTSIREKTLTTKKDAQEEARLRMQAQEVMIVPVDNVDSVVSAAATAAALSKSTFRCDRTESMVVGAVAVSPPGRRTLPEGRDNESMSCNESIAGSHTSAPSSPTAVELPTEAACITDSNGKINIHVSVTINAGTLADLKKQRASMRNGSVHSHASLSNGNDSLGPPSPSPASPPPLPLPLALPLAPSPGPASLSGGEGLLLTPSDLGAPGPVKRFTGTMSDVVDDARSRRCCVVS